MGLIRFLAILFLFYLIYKLVTGFFKINRRTRDFMDSANQTEKEKQKAKIIPKDEGEYVDFEDVE